MHLTDWSYINSLKQPLKNGKIQDDESKVERTEKEKRASPLHSNSYYWQKQKKEKKFQIWEWSVILTKHDIILLTACFSAENVQRNRSPYRGKIGEQIASEITTIIDDGTAPGRLNTRKMDGEGVHSQRTVVVEKGILNLYDRFRGYDHTPYALRATQSQQCWGMRWNIVS